VKPRSTIVLNGQAEVLIGHNNQDTELHETPDQKAARGIAGLTAKADAHAAECEPYYQQVYDGECEIENLLRNVAGIIPRVRAEMAAERAAREELRILKEKNA
jgi:hypothetical protein